MPDFDIDFCMDRRDEVIKYVANRYGREKVAQIVTFGTMAAKAVVRDVGRVLGMPYPVVDKIAKLIPNTLGITLKDALEQESMLREKIEKEPEVKELFKIAFGLEGLVRGVGRHAGGVVIAPSALSDFVPVYRSIDEPDLMTQLDKDDVEKIGLVKFDFLGLRTLTIIDWTCKHIKESTGEEVEIDLIPLDDKPTFEMLCNHRTAAVFQLESRGMTELVVRLKPDRFDDLVALVALYRPGPLQSGMVDDYVDRKHQRAEVTCFFDCLEPILEPTYGVILYQEQVMQIAQVLSGYSLGGADLLRRAMGKKKVEEMEKQRGIFIKGAVDNGHKAEDADYLFSLIEKFAGYGFNKSHSVAYALLSYQTAWLKVHYPSQFFASVLSSDMDNTDKVVSYLEACKVEKVTVLPPCISKSHSHFSVVDSSTILYGLGAVKGVGDGFIYCLLRNDLRKVNSRICWIFVLDCKALSSIEGF